MSDVVKWAKLGLSGAKAALNRGEMPRAFVRRFGALSGAEKALVAREVPGFVSEYVAVAARMRQLGESRACDREVRGMR